MRLQRLRAEHLRLFDEVELAPGPGLNLLLGPNGAGKTSLLEAVHLLGYGRTFRAGPRDAVVQRGQPALTLFAEIADRTGEHRLGLQRSGRDWLARVDGTDVPTLSELFRHCAVIVFEPGSHELIAGPAELRRRYLDWGLFHVEQDFLDVWRRYQRALRQRNALLRQGGAPSQLSGWEAELDLSGARLHQWRLQYVDALTPQIAALASALFPSGGAPQLRYQPGWRAEQQSLAEALAEHRERDVQLGYTVPGPHRANWSLQFEQIPERESLSRGQEKLAALTALLAQAALFADGLGEWPILCLDDLASELDSDHQARTVAWLQQAPAQALVSGTAAPAGWFETTASCMFHVEQGRVAPLL